MRLLSTWLLVALPAALYLPGQAQAFVTFPNAFTVRLEMGIKDFFYSFLGTEGHRVQNRRNEARKLKKLQPVLKHGSFPCNQSQKFRSPVRPSSVHQLMPGDIDIIAALGDSLTAGFGASASLQWQVPIENRGLAWSIGGDENWRSVLTLPNILREFNPALIGFSIGDGPAHSRNAGFNVAEGGATSSDLLYMTKVLVKRIKGDKRINFQKDWKLVTVLIGNNDICVDLCTMKQPLDLLPTFKKNVVESLDYLRDNMPNTLVNVVPLGRIDLLLHGMTLPLSCYATQRVFCPCLFGPNFERNKIRYSDIVHALQIITDQIVTDRRYENLDTFAVVKQPFTERLVFPSFVDRDGRNVTDITLLAPDCFHLSQMGFARSANALWNNMLEPLGEKTTNWQDTFSVFKCPTDQWPYIYTRMNTNGVLFKRSLSVH